MRIDAIPAITLKYVITFWAYLPPKNRELFLATTTADLLTHLIVFPRL
jgi:hypothetical protein